MTAQERQTRAALVTGGARGIGRVVARVLLERGYEVAIADIDDRALREAKALLEPHGEVLAISMDVSNEREVRRAIAEIVDAFGGLDGLVNNAGIADPKGGPIETLSVERWNAVLATNLTGAFLCAKHAAAHLRHRRGAIVNIASTRALMSEPRTEAYAASKGGLLALTHALAISLGPEVRANAVSPGWIDVSEHDLTDQDHAQHPAGRVGVPEDVAAAVAYLLSTDASFVTGQNLIVDGGMTRKMIYAG